jgi:hypothetical protein
MPLDRIAGVVPDWTARPLSIAAGVFALAGSVLVFAATAYASWVMLIAAVGAFALAGACWQVADRMALRH